MSSFISYLISGISLGSVYAIIALGYTMVYGIAKMLNFAHGDVIMVGSYVVYVAVSGMGLNPILAILLSIIICTLMGVVIEGVAYRPLRNAASPLAVLITAIGVSYLLQNVALLIWGADTKSFSNVISLPSLKLAGGSIVITGVTIVTIIGGILIMAGLMLFISKTKTGQAMLAVIGQQQLEVHLPRFADGGGVGLHDHPLRHGQHTRRLQRPRSRIHYAQTARTDLVHVLQIAQSGNIDARFLGSLQNGRTGRHLNTYAVNRKLDEFFHLLFLLSTISSWRSRRSGTFPCRRHT